MNDGILATGWAISAGERFYLARSANHDEVMAAYDAAYDAYSWLMEYRRLYAEPSTRSMNPEAHAASRAAMFAYAVIQQLPDWVIETRLQAARDAFKVAYP